MQELRNAKNPAAKQDGSTRPGVTTVSHAIAVIKALPSNGGLIGVSEIARTTGLHKSTVSRMLATLEEHQFVQRDANRQARLGVGLVALVSPMLGSVDLMRLCKPILSSLAAQTGETAILAVWNGREAVMLEQVIGPQAVVYYAWPGKTVPGHSTAVGKIFMAMAPGAFNLGDATAFTRFTPHTVTCPSEIAAMLEECRKRGYAVNDEENELESCGVAAPILDFSKSVVAALSLAVPKHRFNSATIQALIDATRQKAEILSKELGWSAGRSDNEVA